MRTSVAMPLMPPKPPQQFPSTWSFRPPPRHQAWLKARLDDGWSPSEVLIESVDTMMHLDTRLAEVLPEVERYARETGLLTDATPPEDRGWLREAMARLIIERTKDRKRSK